MNRGKRIGGPRLKGFLSYAACITLNKLMRLPTTDATNAFKCFRRSVIEQIKIESTQGFEMPLELTVKAFSKGLRITDVPTTWRDKRKGVIKILLLEQHTPLPPLVHLWNNASMKSLFKISNFKFQIIALLLLSLVFKFLQLANELTEQNPTYQYA